MGLIYISVFVLTGLYCYIICKKARIKTVLRIKSIVVLITCELLYLYFLPLHFTPTTLSQSHTCSSTNSTISWFTLSNINVISNYSKSWQELVAVKSVATDEKNYHKKPRGYVLALSYWDQQTSALRNLLSLQCWARQVELVVVEPFIIGSDFGMQVVEQNNHSDKMVARFRDLFDINQWNDPSHTKVTPLVSWKNFLENAPQNVILVEMKYTDHPMKFPELPLDVTCKKKILIRQFFRVFGSHGFHLQRMVCFDFQKLGILTTRQFNTYLFGKFDPSSVSVVFIEWRGIVTSVFHRIMLQDSVCGNGLGYTNIAISLNPSQKIIKHSEQYIQRYLHGGDYVAIALRLERIFPAGKNNVLVCLNKTLGYLSRIKQGVHAANTFLSIDVGRFGSKGYKRNPLMEFTVTQQVEKLIDSMAIQPQSKTGKRHFSTSVEHPTLVILHSYKRP